MYLKKTYRKDSGRTYLVLAHKYRDPNTGISKDRTFKSLGYLDELEKIYDDPVTYFKEEARRLTEEESLHKLASFQVNMDETLPEGAQGSNNFGYAIPLKIYHELGIDTFLKNRARNEDFKFNTNSIMTLLMLSRMLSPGSKKKAFEEKDRYFERFHFFLDDVYRSLSYFNKISNDLQKYLHENVRAKYGSNTDTVYYIIASYHFKIPQPDELRKDNKPKPIVQMGLATDKNGIPIHYELFPGDKLNDQKTFRRVIDDLKKSYDTERVIVIADTGMITGDNLNYLVGNKPKKPKNGYIISLPVRIGTKRFQEYVIDKTSYANFKLKSRVAYRRDIYVTTASGDMRRKSVYEKQVVLCSKNIAEDKNKDDYYAIVTSETHLSVAEIIDIYQGLWEIEQRFRITESDLEARPVYIQNFDYINAHCLICFIAQTILRLIQKKIGNKYSAKAIINCLNRIECISEHENIYLFGYRSEISDTLGKAFAIDLAKKRLSLSEIKGVLGDVKK